LRPDSEVIFVSAAAVSGQVLQQRYGFGAASVGFTVITFGVGLAIGNMSTGRLRKLCDHEEVSLLVVMVLLITAIALFILILSCLPPQINSCGGSINRRSHLAPPTTPKQLNHPST